MRNPADVVASRLNRMQDSARLTRSAVTRTKPTVAVELGRTLPCWVLRAVGTLLGVVAILLLSPGIVAEVIMAITLVLFFFRSSATTGAVFCAALGLFWMLEPTAPFAAPTFALLAIGPLVWSIGGVCAGLPLRTKIEWRALKPTAIRYLIIQLITQLLLAGAQLLQLHGPPLAGPLAGLLAFAFAIAIAVAAWLILPNLTSRANDR